MSNIEIVVVGAGVAGLSAALAVAGTGHDVTLVTKAELVESNTYHAQGGIAAAIFSDDDPKLHAADTMAAGHGLCDPKAVDILTREGAERVREFAAAGVHFDRDAHGHMLRGLEAAHSRARVVHAGGDATGKVFELDVSAMVRKNPRIHIIENAFLKDLIVRGGHIAGVHLLIDGQDKDLAADRVILAAGGAGRMYPYTTNPPVATADGLAVAWRAGAQVADLEFYQFHPTAMAVGEHFLVSEAVRGEGAVLLDEHGHRYMKDIDPRAELAPRDVVARENFRVMQAQGGKPVMLDVSPMARENPDLASFLAHRFPTIDAYTRSLGFDWSKEPIPVAPAARGIDLAGAIRHVREQVGHTTHIEVEVDRLDQIPAVLAGGADTIMLDNFSLDDTRRGVELIDGKAIVEASGNMSLERVPAVAVTGVDVISVGALTHSVRSIDLGLDWN